MTRIHALALAAFLLAPGASLADPSTPDMGSDAGRMAAARAMSGIAGKGLDAFSDALRLRPLLDARAPGGIGIGEVRSALARPGQSAEATERRVRAAMSADADGDGRITRAEYLDAGASALGGVLASLKGLVAERGGRPD